MARESFTAGRVADFTCPAGKRQAFKWDAKAPGLALRVTAGGARARFIDAETGQVTIHHVALEE